MVSRPALHTEPARVSVLDDATLALHGPDLSPPQVTELLCHLVVELGLAQECAFVAAAASTDHAAPAQPRTRSTRGHRRTVAAQRGARRLTVDVPGPGGVSAGSIAYKPTPDSHGAQEQMITMLAAHAGAAYAAADRRNQVQQQQEATRRLAERLQDALLPKLPEVAGLSLEVRYRAAAREARVGGDFYDVFPLPNGCVLIVVGDVVGKGVEAASRTSRITQTLRTLAMQGMALDELLEHCDELVIYQDPQLLATVWCGLYDPVAAELTFTSLGHPPALLLRGDAEAVRLELEGLPLGMRDLADTPPEIRRRHLEPRDLLVLYTDGVVEASKDFLAGQEALLSVMSRQRNDPLSTMIDVALDEMLAQGGHADDALMLLIRRR